MFGSMIFFHGFKEPWNYRFFYHRFGGSQNKSFKNSFSIIYPNKIFKEIIPYKIVLYLMNHEKPSTEEGQMFTIPQHVVLANSYKIQ